MTPSREALPQGYVVRPTQAEDCALLPVIERASAELFRGTDLISFDQVQPVSAHTASQAQGLHWVAQGPDGAVIGFCMADMIDGDFYLEELAVHPAHGRKGLGQALVMTCCREAAQRGLLPVYLSTFTTVPWNAPFYTRLGFRAVSQSDYKPWQHRQRANEAESLDISQRCIMRWDG